MSNLFSDNFPVISTNKELEELCANYPEYDRAYVCQGSGAGYNKRRNVMEELWQIYQPYADSKFLNGFKRDFSGRTWELYLGSTFLRRGYELEKVGDKGPDLKVLKDGFHTYIEAISTTSGSGVDKVPGLTYGIASSVPSNEIQLRVANALSVKKKVYEDYLTKNIIKSADPFIIAVNRSAIEGPGDPIIPIIMKCLFGIGDPCLQIGVGDERPKNPNSFWTGKPILTKKSGSPVQMLFFEDLANVGISAVMYSTNSILNSPTEPKFIGENIHIIHNPNARNPIPDGFFIFGEERRAKDGFINITRKAKEFERPTIF